MGNFLVFLHCNLYSCFADIEWISEKAAIVPDIDPDKTKWQTLSNHQFHLLLGY